jgi:hypothetical protein
MLVVVIISSFGQDWMERLGGKGKTQNAEENWVIIRSVTWRLSGNF